MHQLYAFVHANRDKRLCSQSSSPAARSGSGRCGAGLRGYANAAPRQPEGRATRIERSAPWFFEKLGLQLDPHSHVSAAMPGATSLHPSASRHGSPLRSALELATVQELPPPPIQLRLRKKHLPAHLADVLLAQQPQHYLEPSAVRSSTWGRPVAGFSLEHASAVLIVQAMPTRPPPAIAVRIASAVRAMSNGRDHAV